MTSASAPTLARLGLIVDGTQVRSDNKLTVESLKAVSAAGRETRDELRRLIPPETERSASRLSDSIRRMQEASRQRDAGAFADQIARLDPFQKAAANSGSQLAQTLEKTSTHAAGGHLAIGRINQALEGLAFEALGANTKLGSIGTKLVEFGVGGIITTAVLAGLAAIALAWEKVTENSRKAKEAQESSIKRLEELGKKQQFGEYGEDIVNAATKLNAIRADRARIEALSGGPGGFIAGSRKPEIDEYKRQEEELIKTIQIGVNAQLETDREKTKQKIENAKEAADKQIAEMQRVEQATRDYYDLLGKLQDERIQRERQAAERSKELNDKYGITTAKVWSDGAQRGAAADNIAAMKIPQSVMDDLQKFGLSQKQALDVSLRVAEVTRQVTEEEKKQTALKQVILSNTLSLLSQMGGAWNMLSGIASAAMAGASGGPWGVAISGLSALAGAVLNSGKAAHEAALRMEEMRRSISNTILEWKAELGDPGADDALKRARIHQDAAAAKKQLEEAYPEIYRYSGSGMGVTATNTHQRDAEYYSKLQAINDAEKRRIEQLGQEKEALDVEKQRAAIETARRWKEATEDLNVRMLRATGATDDQVEAMETALRRQREYEQAVRDGADATYTARLQQVQQAEDVARAIEKTKGTIAGLTATIDGLQGFKDSLKLSDAFGLTDPQKLDEARRQYQEILQKALAGDQGAAGRLPAAAQQLLELSQKVNSTGPDFVRDRDKVISDTDAVMKIFQDQRSIAQQQLDALLEIQRVMRLEETLIATNDPRKRFPFGTGSFDANLTPADLSPVAENTQNTVLALVTGFRELSGKLDETNSRLEEVVTTTRNAAEGYRL